MTNKRITELTALDGDDVADNDVLAIVDVSDTTMAASGTTKKITVAELVTDSALTNKFWPNSTTALTGANLANGDKLAVVDVGSPDVAKYITADELAQGSQFSSRYKALASDTIWIAADEFKATLNTPAMGQLEGNDNAFDVPVLLFDASTLEFSVAVSWIPSSWATIDVYVWWANAGAGAGDVRLYGSFQQLVNGSDINGSNIVVSGTYPGNVLTAAAENVVTRTKLNSSAKSVTANRTFNMFFARVGTDASDTLANDIGLIGIEVVRVS